MTEHTDTALLVRRRCAQAVAGYVQEIHRAYVDQAATFPPGVRGADAADDRRSDHGRRGRRPQPAPPGHHRGASARCAARRSRWTRSYGGVAWDLRFYDPVVLPDLGAARRARGSRRSRRSSARSASARCSTTWSPSPAPASRATRPPTSAPGWPTGTPRAARDFETIRSRARGREALVDELAGAAIARAPPRPGAAGPRDLAVRRRRARGVRAAHRPTPTRSARRC